MKLYSMRAINGTLPSQEIKNAINNLHFLCENLKDYIEYTNASYTKQTNIDINNLKWHYWWKNEGSTDETIGDKVVKPGQAYIVQADKTKPLIVDVSGGAGSYYIINSINSSDNKINLNFKYIEKATDLYGEKQYFIIPTTIGNRYYDVSGDKELKTLNEWLSLDWTNDTPEQKITSKSLSNSTPVAFQSFDPISVELLYGDEEFFVDGVIKTKSSEVNGRLNHSILVELKDINKLDWENSFKNSTIKPQARIW